MNTEVFIYVFPGMMFFWLFFIGQSPMQEIVTEKDNNTLHRILSTPVTLNQFLISKLIRCFCLCFIIQVLLIVVSWLIFGVSWGNPFTRIFVIVVNNLAITGIMALIHSLGRTRDQSNAISTMVILMLALLGGGMFPFEEMPPFMKVIGEYTPIRWGIVLLQSVMQNRPLTEVLSYLILLLVFGAIGIFIGLLMFKRRFKLLGTLISNPLPKRFI